MILEKFTCIFMDADQLEQSLTFYQPLLNGTVTLRFPYPEKSARNRRRLVAQAFRAFRR